MFTIGNIVWLTVQFLVGYNLVLPLLLYLLYLVRKKQAFDAPVNRTADYAVIVTAYEHTDLLPAVVGSILKMDYQHFIVYVVADKCDVSQLHFEDQRVVILRPPEVLASNTRSHFYAIRHFIRNHERLTIIDSDNIVAPDYLNKLNACFDAGYIAVQGQREAKNLDTTLACLDAARDIYYHFYDGRLLFQIGSSATLAGSGMAFTVQLYRDCLEHLDITGAGFDKVLQAAIVQRGHRIAYAPDAIIYDEKTSGSDQLVKQRARWINTWFKYSRLGFSLMGKGILRFDFNRFIFGLILLRPPLFIFLLSSVFFTTINIFIDPVMAYLWLSGLLFFVTGFCIALWNSKVDPRIYRSLTHIPKFIFYQVASLLKVRRANSYSVATKHTADKPQAHD
jgi:cellulose synthase/poly-beta-1,6-N-acetylglucosamine synthase-like glycosyltransferase